MMMMIMIVQGGGIVFFQMSVHGSILIISIGMFSHGAFI